MANIRFTQAPEDEEDLLYSYSTHEGTDEDPHESHETVADAIGTSNTALSAINGKLPAQGQALAAASIPVVLTAAQQTALTPPAAITGFATAANQTADAALTGAVTETAPTTDTASSGLNGRLQRIAQRLTSLFAPRAAASTNVHVPSSNTAAIITYAAGGASVSHVISGIAWSYSAAPTAGNLKIEDGSGTTVFSVDITAAGPGFIPFAAPLKGTANTAMIITLAAGGSGVSGKINALGKWTE